MQRPSPAVWEPPAGHIISGIGLPPEGKAKSLLRGRDLLFHLRCDDCTWTDALQTVDDDLFADVEAAFDYPLAVGQRAELDLPIGDLVLTIDDEDELLVLV